jgi:hypothetical protein
LTLCADPTIAPHDKVKEEDMPRFLVEVEHEAETIACARAVQILLRTGSHFLTHADFGCFDGDHRAWIVVEGEAKNEVLMMLPPALRPRARIVGLNKFSLDQIEGLLKAHGA